MSRPPIPFRGFDERGEVRVYQHGILPHWRQDGCTYFVTFRQADSLPANVIRETEYERQLWLRHRAIDPNAGDWKQAFTRLSSADQRAYERLVGSFLNRQLDQHHGSCVLARRELASIVEHALSHFDGQRLHTGDYVVMPNHVHALMTPLSGFKLEDILHSVKSYTAHRINHVLGRNGTFWQRQSYDHMVRDYEQLEAYQKYIEANPSKANLPLDDVAYGRRTYLPYAGEP